MSAFFAICFTVLFMYGECGIIPDKEYTKNGCKVIECQSIDFKEKICPVGLTDIHVVNTTLLYQMSETPCAEDENYLYQGNALIVNDGCRGIFKVCYRATLNIEQSEESTGEEEEEEEEEEKVEEETAKRLLSYLSGLKRKWSPWK